MRELSWAAEKGFSGSRWQKTHRNLGRALGFTWLLGWGGKTSYFNNSLFLKMSLAGCTVLGPPGINLT